MYIMHTKVIFPQMNRMASVGGGQRIGIDIGGHGERSDKISYAQVTRCFVDHNWEVELHFEKKSKSLEGFGQ